MILLFTNYLKFAVKEVRVQNLSLYNFQYNEYDEQNNKEAIECFLNSLNAVWRKMESTRMEMVIIFKNCNGGNNHCENNKKSGNKE